MSAYRGININNIHVQVQGGGEVVLDGGTEVELTGEEEGGEAGGIRVTIEVQ